MTDCALRAAGLKVGRYTSPHLVRLEERFAVDGAPVDTAVLVELVEEMRRLIDDLHRERVARIAPDLLRGDDGDRLRDLPARACGGRGARSRPRRAPRLDEHRAARCGGHHVDRFRSRTVSRQHARRDRRRESRRHQARHPGRRRSGAGRGARCHRLDVRAVGRRVRRGGRRRACRVDERRRAHVDSDHDTGARLRLGAARPPRRPSGAERPGRRAPARGIGAAAAADRRRRLPPASATCAGRAGCR